VVSVKPRTYVVWPTFIHRSATLAVVDQSYLRHREYLYLKLSLFSLAAAIVAYVASRPRGGGNGGTWLGYTLGVISAGLIVWLMLLGLRKRSYQAGGVMLSEWVSAHVYL